MLQWNGLGENANTEARGANPAGKENALEISWIVPIVLLLVVVPMLNRQRRLTMIAHMVQNRKRKEERNDMNNMKELAEQFVGKECIVYTVLGSDGIVKGTLKEVTDGGIVMEQGGNLDAVNFDFIVRIREWPRNKNGKKKTVFS